jgi:oxidase EvaA
MKARQGLRFLKSLHTRSKKDIEILDWITERRLAVKHQIKQIDLKDLKGWEFADRGISHNSGKFFQIKYLRSTMDNCTWDQPIINQPEIGILGFIVKEVDEVLHFLVQAKIEPGNINIVQLSPTVQSTKSNFTKVHGGALTPFVEYFLDEKSTILVDQLQSEQGARFFQKRNRNIIIEVEEELEHTDYIWMTLGDLVAMSKYPNTVNMDSRTVISCIHFGSFDERNFEVGTYMGAATSPWIYSMLRRDVYEHSHPEILSMITNLRFRREAEVKKIGLEDTNQWIYENGSIKHQEGKYFDIVGYEIFIANRESKSWSQPMVQPKSHGICCFFAKKENGVYYLLVQLKDEVGSFDGVEMAPTIQTSIENLETSPYFDTFNKISTVKRRTLLDVMQSEEGGRFYQEQNRNMILDVTGLNLEENSRFIWLTVHQIKTFLQYNNYVNIQTRSIISSLPL